MSAIGSSAMPRRLPPGCVEDRDRHGNVRIYYRMKGRLKVRLRGTPWTPDFMAEYEAAKGQAVPILFSDILVVPHALGQCVSFAEGEGPRLDALKDPAALGRLRDQLDHAALAPVYEAIARVRQDLPAAVTLVGFCGAPWTVATYMIAREHGNYSWHVALVVRALLR
jgi:Uroporphyrinogen decarboxylase (URO-D)